MLAMRVETLLKPASDSNVFFLSKPAGGMPLLLGALGALGLSGSNSIASEGSFVTAVVSSGSIVVSDSFCRLEASSDAGGRPVGSSDRLGGADESLLLPGTP